MRDPINGLSLWQLPEVRAWSLRRRWRFTVEGIAYCLRKLHGEDGWLLHFKKGGETVTIKSRYSSLEPDIITVNGYKWEKGGMYGGGWYAGSYGVDRPPTGLPPQVVAVVNAAIQETAKALAPIVADQVAKRERKDDARQRADQAREQSARSRRSQHFAATMSHLE